MQVDKKVAAGLAAGAVAVAGTGVAFAYWTTTGSGSGTAGATTGNPAAVAIVTSTTTPLAAMFPGDSPQPLKATVSNTDAHQRVYVSHVFAYLTVAKADGVTAACDSSDFSLDGVTGTTAAAVTDDKGDTTGGPVQLQWTAQELNAQGPDSTKPAAGSFADTTTGDTVQFADKSDVNQDGCKGAVVTIHYSSN